MGWLVAIAYLVCMLAPAAALAWGHGPVPCLVEGIDHEVMRTELHPAHQHMQAGHDHGGAPLDHSVVHANHHGSTPDPSGGHSHDGKQGPCCAMMCVSALPSPLPVVSKPAQPTFTCTTDRVASLHEAAPPLLYRPPIA